MRSSLACLSSLRHSGPKQRTNHLKQMLATFEIIRCFCCLARPEKSLINCSQIVIKRFGYTDSHIVRPFDLVQVRSWYLCYAVFIYTQYMPMIRLHIQAFLNTKVNKQRNESKINWPRELSCNHHKNIFYLTFGLEFTCETFFSKLCDYSQII